MKRGIIICFVGITAALLLILWPRSTRETLPAIDSTVPMAARSTTIIAQSHSPSITQDTNAPAMVGSPLAEADGEKLKKRQSLSQQYDGEWLTPIEFYGLVIDESNNPVADVQIDFSCSDMSPTGTSDYHAASGANGLFSLKNVTGKLLVIKSISKSGYYTSKKDNNSFEYGAARLTPDPNSPIVFHLRKKLQGADLVMAEYPAFAHIAQLKHDGTPIELDLFKGTQAAAGDGELKLEFTREFSNTRAKTFNWKLQISVPHGGLLETDEEFPFLAPTSGYQSLIAIDMQTNYPDWRGDLKAKYYFRLPDGKYGRFDFEFLPYNGVYTIRSAINPDGSQNLEPISQ